MIAQRDRVTVQISKDIRSLLEALKYKEDNESILVRKSLHLGLTLIELAEKLKLPLPRANELIDWLTSYGFSSNQTTNEVIRKEDRQVSGDVPANVYTGFKAACVKKGITESAGLEQAILLWLSQELQKETSQKLDQATKNGSSKTATSVSESLKSASRRPTDGDCINMAREIGVREELVLKLRDRLFDAKKD